MRHLKLRTWLMGNGLKQLDLAAGVCLEESLVSKRVRRDGFSADERDRILEWAQRVRPALNVKREDLFEPEAA
jgi:hypothetical protein